jgi:hypothetical protein
MRAMLPTTTETIKLAAPMSSPIARPPEFAFIAENVENTSGEPLPNARKVTPATFSSRPRITEIDARFGQKKSEAEIPRVEKRKRAHITRAMK